MNKTMLIHEALIEHRNWCHDEAEKALDRRDMPTFMKHAREFHRLASLVGYP